MVVLGYSLDEAASMGGSYTVWPPAICLPSRRRWPSNAARRAALLRPGRTRACDARLLAMESIRNTAVQVVGTGGGDVHELLFVVDVQQGGFGKVRAVHEVANGARHGVGHVGHEGRRMVERVLGEHVQPPLQRLRGRGTGQARC